MLSLCSQAEGTCTPPLAPDTKTSAAYQDEIFPSGTINLSLVIKCANSHALLTKVQSEHLTMEMHDPFQSRGVSGEMRCGLASQWKLFASRDDYAFL